MKKRLILTLVLGLTVSINLYPRFFPAFFPQLKERAREEVEKRIKQEIVKSIDKKLPQYNPLAKNQVIEKAISFYTKNKKSAIENQIKAEYIKLKDRYQDAGGQTYLSELDCWHWARYTDNVYRFGHPGDKVIAGKQIDALMLAPNGSQIPWNQFLFYFSAWAYRGFSLIQHVPLFNFLYYLPLLFFTIFIISLYLFCYTRWGNLGALISCLFIGLSPIFLVRSAAGWFDMDTLNLLFPLLIYWAYVKSYERLSLSHSLRWLCLAGFAVGLFAFTWGFWWFIFVIIIAFEIYAIITSPLLGLIRKKPALADSRQHIFSLLLFILFSCFWVLVFSGIAPLQAFYEQLRGVLILNDPVSLNFWPNVLSTVGELRRPDLKEIAGVINNFYLSFLALGCLLLLFSRSFLDERRPDTTHPSLGILVFWFISTYIACFKGIRFTMFLLIPLGISLGWVISETYEYFRQNHNRLRYILLPAVFILGLTLFDGACSAARNIYPMIDDNWYQALVHIRDNTPKGAVVDSWWDFGDWFKAISRRPVIFDGQSQNSPQAYWMANLLLGSEEDAAGILRMLNNGGNRAFDIINAKLKDPLASIFWLKKAMHSKPEAAREELMHFLPSPSVEELVRILFSKPGSAYFVVDYTMLKKIYSISFIANWDFANSYIATERHRKSEKQVFDYLGRLGMDNQTVTRLYQEAGLISNETLDSWISLRESFHNSLGNGKDRNGIVFFDNGLVYNQQKKTVYFYSNEHRKYEVPKSLFIFNDDKMEEVVYPENDFDFSVLIFPEKEELRAIMLDTPLAKSLLVRLYFLEGKGLKYFKPFFESNDGEKHILVYEIIWS